MNTLEFKNFTCSCFCRGRFFSGLSSCNYFTYKFTPGLYTILGEIDSGGWAITYSLLPNKLKKYDIWSDTRTSISFNNEEIPLKEIQNHSWNITDFPTKRFDKTKKKTIRQRIAAGIKKSGLKYTVNEIKEMFDLSDHRFDYSIQQISGEYIRANAAIGFANGKDIFCYDWLSQKETRSYYTSINIITKILTEHNKIIILPCSQDAVRLDFGTVLDFSRNAFTIEFSVKEKIIPEIMEYLNCNADIDAQERAIEICCRSEDITPFIKPSEYGKDVLENCAKIVVKKSDLILYPYLDRLIEWMQELHEPGAIIIQQRLKEFNGELLVFPFERFVKKAMNLDNEDTDKILKSLSRLLDNEELKAVLSNEISEILHRYY